MTSRNSVPSAKRIVGAALTPSREFGMEGGFMVRARQQRHAPFGLEALKDLLAVNRHLGGRVDANLHAIASRIDNGDDDVSSAHDPLTFLAT